jgi:cytidyltransferase-like protein
MTTVIAAGSFDNLRSRHVRFLEEAAKLGELHVLLWSDEVARRLEGRPPKFPQSERQYLVEAVRYVDRVTLVTEMDSPDGLPEFADDPALKCRSERAKGTDASWGEPPDGAAPTWAVDEADDTAAKRAFCAFHGLTYRVFTAADLAGFPDEQGSGIGSQESRDDRRSSVVGRRSSVVRRPSSVVRRRSSVVRPSSSPAATIGCTPAMCASSKKPRHTATCTSWRATTPTCGT